MLACQANRVAAKAGIEICDERAAEIGKPLTSCERPGLGPIRRECLRGSLRLSRLGCRQLGRRDAQQLAESVDIVEQRVRDEVH